MYVLLNGFDKYVLEEISAWQVIWPVSFKHQSKNMLASFLAGCMKLHQPFLLSSTLQPQFIILITAKIHSKTSYRQKVRQLILPWWCFLFVFAILFFPSSLFFSSFLSWQCWCSGGRGWLSWSPTRRTWISSCYHGT